MANLDTDERSNLAANTRVNEISNFCVNAKLASRYAGTTIAAAIINSAAAGLNVAVPGGKRAKTISAKRDAQNAGPATKRRI